jgi:hypothetical protein
MFGSTPMRTLPFARLERSAVFRCAATNKDEPPKNKERHQRRLHSHKVMIHLNRVKMNSLKKRCVEVCDPNKKFGEQSEQCMEIIDGIKEIAREQQQLNLDYILYMLHENQEPNK